MRAVCFRLRPGQDLHEGIAAAVSLERIQAGVVLSAVGSLARATLRLANREGGTEYQGPFEIVSMTGTVSVHGSHLHVSISDGDGVTSGGHLLPGCVIYTTAEIVLGALDEVVFKRELAEDSGYEELVVAPR